MWTLDSPNKELKVMIEQQGDGSLRYCVSKHGKKVMEERSMGICTDLGDFTEGLLFEKEERAVSYTHLCSVFPFLSCSGINRLTGNMFRSRLRN